MPIVLLDVDDTTAMSNRFYGQHDGGYRYHTPLLQALKCRGLTEIYLFTAYVLRGVAKSLEDEVISTPSRLKLINYLISDGFTVLGSITTLDVVFAQSLGAYYTQIILPYEDKVLQGENLLTGRHAGSYQSQCEKELELREKADKGLLGDKSALYEYVIKEAREKNFQQLEEGVIVIDDRPEILEMIKKKHQQLGYSHKLKLIHAEPHTTLEDYEKLLTWQQSSNKKKVVRCAVS